LVALRLVPLPDFVVYPESTQDTKNQDTNIRMLPLQLLRIFAWPRGYAIKEESKLSPFLRVIRRDKNGIVLDNPAIEAVIDFKWGSARNHFLRHASLFLCFFVLFVILTGAVKNSFVTGKKKFAVDVDPKLKITTNIMILLFYYIGYYLLASEIVQFKHEGWRRYISVYNFFDLASVIMPLATYTVEWARESKFNGEIPVNQFRQLTIATSFTVLILWLELVIYLAKPIYLVISPYLQI